MTGERTPLLCIAVLILCINVQAVVLLIPYRFDICEADKPLVDALISNVIIKALRIPKRTL